MNTGKGNSAFHFFIYLLLFFSLGFVAFGAGAILFQFINKIFPQEAFYSYQSSFNQGAVKFAIASLFVSGPIFFLSSLFIGKKLVKGEISADSHVRKWLTYIVLFFAAATVIGDMIALIVNFLEGDVAPRFLLKVLVILLIAGSILGYYFWNIRISEFSKKERLVDKYSFLASVFVVAILFVGAFFIIDSPATSRNKKIDAQTLRDVQNIDSSIRSYFSTSGRLPENLEDLKMTEFSPFVSMGTSAVYEKKGEKTFNLCADFILSDQEGEVGGFPLKSSQDDWRHGKGEVCFERIAVDQQPKPSLFR